MTTTREVEGETLTPGLYRHIKTGGLYTVIGLVRHHETGHAMVVYYSHGHDTVSTRPLHGFAYFDGCCDRDGFLSTPGGPFKRFELVTDPPPTELWVSSTLRRSFDLFEVALRGVGRPSEPLGEIGRREWAKDKKGETTEEIWNRTAKAIVEEHERRKSLIGEATAAIHCGGARCVPIDDGSCYCPCRSCDAAKTRIGPDVGSARNASAPESPPSRL